jgi:hypothetical protein
MHGGTHAHQIADLPVNIDMLFLLLQGLAPMQLLSIDGAICFWLSPLANSLRPVALASSAGVIATVTRPMEDPIRAISRQGGALWHCPMPWRGSTAMPPGNGPGNGCFPRGVAGEIRGRASGEGTISIRVSCSAPYVQPCRLQGSANRPRARPSAIHSPRTYWNWASTSARFRNCSATAMVKPPWSTPM